MTAFSKLITLIFPNRCVFCDKVIRASINVCSDCIKGIKQSKNHNVFYTKFGKIKCVSPFVYEKLPKKAVLTLKFRNAKNNAKALSAYMVFEIRKHYRDVKFDYAAYIPCTPKKKKARGYNQSELLYKEIAPWINVSDDTHLLVKTHDTQDQKRLFYKQRLQNLTDAFILSSEYDVKNKTILLIDDVHTTGATIDAAARTLYNAGAKQVLAATFARVKRKSNES